MDFPFNVSELFKETFDLYHSNLSRVYLFLQLGNSVKVPHLNKQE